MRVLQVVTNMDRGGLETMLMNYYRHIDRTKVQFDFLTHRRERAAYDDEIEALGGKIYRLPRLIPWSKHYLSALDDFFTSHPEYKVIHVHQDCLSSIVLRVAAKHGVPVRIAHSHSASQDKDIKYLVKRFYMKYIPRYATNLFACSNAAGKWMFQDNSYQLISNAIDASEFSFGAQKRGRIREEFGFNDDTLVVGHVGSFWAVKNHTFLIDVFSILEKINNTAKLLLVGYGGRMEEIREKVKNLGLCDKVIFTGIRTDVSDLMQAMDVFVFPSLYEGLPVTMVEAQAAGLPCIISDKVPPECILTEGLVDIMPLSASPEVWAEKVLSKRAIPRTDRRAEIAAHGFDITTEAVKLQEFYLEAYEQNC